MYKIYLRDDKIKYELTELVKMFLKPSEFEICEEDGSFGNQFRNQDDQISCDGSQDPSNIFHLPETAAEKNECKRILYDWLSEKTGKSPQWGTLTGVRPVKLAGEYFKRGMNRQEVSHALKEIYYLSEEKRELLLDICENQKRQIPPVKADSVGIYIGIPFCPTRCLYCSFTSNQASKEKIEHYLKALHQEISYVGDLMKRKGLTAESIYIGGGTPTTLDASQLESLISHVNASFFMGHVKEFTVEAGRPDTITEEKLKVISGQGVNRISINPQTMKARTLELIGRSHSPKDIREAFQMAKEVGIEIINADLIAGLPEESPLDFQNSLEEVIGLGPQNITVHTLAVKRASRLMELDADYHYRQANNVQEMLQIAKRLMEEHDYLPYYMYRQKHMAGNLENVGYARCGTENIYNVRIMEENQTILALGAGAISKIYFPEENRLERVPNVTNYEIYIERIDEMLERKEQGFL